MKTFPIRSVPGVKVPVIRQHKYGAKRTCVNGIWFASKAESLRYAELLTLAKAGAIDRLVLQPRYSLTVNGTKIGEYRGDFEFRENGRLVVEDVKGMMLPLARWKIAHATAEYRAVEFRIVKKK